MIVDIEKEVKRIICEQLGIKEIASMDHSMVDDIGADSLDLVELIMEIEEHFEIDMDDEKLHEEMTVRDVIDQVQDIVNN